MSWDELHTRLGQEFAKRAEYALSRAHLLDRQDRVRLDAPARGNFFFSPEEVAERVQILKEHLPSAVSETVEEADEIMQHRFRLLGYRDVDYGADIDWHLDAVHGKRALLQAWYKINFLSFDEVGDHKITWELNRHQHLVTLAKACVFTDDDKYAHELVRQFYSWHAANPYPMGINWGSSLEVAFRSLSWLWVRHLLVDRPRITAEFDRDLVKELARNGRCIERYLSTYFSPNTHLIGEAVALFVIGTLCPQISRAQQWQKKGFDIVLAEAERQVRPDGVYFEQSLYYHVYALDFFLHTRILASCNSLSTPKSFDDIVRKMLEVVRVLSRSGTPQSFGDDDGGRVFNPRRNRAEYLSDPLALGTTLFGQSGVPTAPVTEESIWLCGRAALHEAADRELESLASVAFQDGGLYVIASPGQYDSQMLIDAGPHGIGHGGHGHADALSLTLSIDGRPWITDSGSFVYIGEGNERNQFRGTRAHNTLRVDKLDQAVPEGPFRWSSLPEVGATQWVSGSSFTFFSGHHNGYKRLPDPVLHRRAIFHLHGEYWLVRDIVEGSAAHQLEIFWHLAPDLNVAGSPGVLIASSAHDKLVLLSAGATSWDVSVEQGLISAAYGQRQPAAVGVFRKQAQLPVEHATLMVPMNLSQPNGRFRVADADSSHARGHVYEFEDVSDYLVFANGNTPWNIGPIRSDAAVLYLRVKGRELASLAFSAASFVEFHGDKLLSSDNPIERLEWKRGGELFTSDEGSLKFFDQELLRARIPVRQR